MKAKDNILKLIKDEGWRGIISSFLNTKEGSKFLSNLSFMASKESSIYPGFNEIFKAFNLTPFNSVKVVMLGTRPYRSKLASGIAYGTSGSIIELMPIPYSTQVIEMTLNLTIKEKENFLFDDSLESWAKQGVLLINTSLTTSDKDGHYDLWGPMISYILKSLDNSKMIYVGLGKYPIDVISYSIELGEALFVGDPGEVKSKREWSSSVFNHINNRLKNSIVWY